VPTPEQAGHPSPIFGDRFPYPFDGKTVLFEIANQFAREFNDEAIAQLRQRHGSDRADQFAPLDVTSAYPTTAQHCPRIAIQRVGSSPRPTGLGQQWHEEIVSVPNSPAKVRVYSGQTITDRIEAAICTLNERLRDDLYLWFQQYVIDAANWMVPQLKAVGFYSLQCTNSTDDTVEYQGGQGQPGFQFYTAQMEFAATYDLTVITDVDQLKTIFNWEKVTNAGGLSAGAAGDVEPYESTQPLAPDAVYQNEPSANP
jgi:hypothetical protein